MYAPTESPIFVRISQLLDVAIKADLQNIRDWYFFLLVACTGLVFLGLALEFPEIRHDFIEAIGRRSRERAYWLLPSIERLEYPVLSARAKVISTIGWVLIVVGVGGEGIFESFVSKYDGALSALNDALLSETQRETAVALAQAVHADTTVKGFDLQIATAVQATAEAKKQAESERLARVELEKELEPRRLTGKQKDKLRGLLQDDPQSVVFGFCANGSDDCQDFVNDIGEAFNKAGWKTLFGASLRIKRGIQVGFMKGSDEQLVAHWVPKIRDALQGVGLKSEEERFEPNEKWLVGGFEKNVLYVIVGQKPAITAKAKADSQ
jgi:hypothetical protein